MAAFRIALFGGRGRKTRGRVKSRPGTSLGKVKGRLWLEGYPYEVKVQQTARNGVKIIENDMVVSLSAMTRENFANLLDGWYRRRARKAFGAALARWLPEFEKRGYPVPAPRLKLYKMRRAWGRCYYTKGLITLNLHLAKTPPECFDYIVLHELCHFVVHSHSKAFYALMGDILPGWKTIDETLKDFARHNRILY